jgi:hypothetical protein
VHLTHPTASPQNRAARPVPSRERARSETTLLHPAVVAWNTLERGWEEHDRLSRWILAAVIGVTVVGMCASALTPYSLEWRLLRFTVDVLFFAALLMIVATPAAMHRAARPSRPHGWKELLTSALRRTEALVLQFLTLLIAVLIIVGLLTAPSANAAIIVWRFCTAISAAIVLNSRLLTALWTGGRALRLLSIGSACIQIIALVATISIDIPAILQSADLANAAMIGRLTSPDGVTVPPILAAAIKKNRHLSEFLTAGNGRIVATPAVADVFHFMGPHPFPSVLSGMLGMRWSHKSIECVVASNDASPTSGYRSQKGVVDYVLPIYVVCSPGLQKLNAFIASLPSEATPRERAEDIRRCGSVEAGAAHSAANVLRGWPSVQARILSLLPPSERRPC